MNKIKIDWYFISLILISIIACCCFVGHYNNILIDFGREVYYPDQILNGKVLYKDLFNIYGPFSYLMNALLYKIFGSNLTTLFITGSILATTLIGFIYKISRLFFDKITSFILGFFTIAVGICTTLIFNFTFPYSWAMLYGTLFFAISLFYLLKWTKENSNSTDKFLTVATIFAGMAIANKYEFILYGLFLLFLIIKNGLKHKKQGLINLCGFLIPIVTSYGILFLQGLNFSDLINSFNIVKTIANTETLKYFYVNHGNMFSLKTLIFDFIIFLIILLINLPIFGGIKLWNKNKTASIIILLLSSIITLKITSIAVYNAFIYLPLLILGLAILNYKKIINDKTLLYLIISIFLLCAKSFWALMIFSYGSYYISFLLIALLLLVNYDIKKTITIFLSIISLLIITTNFGNTNLPLLKTENNRIFTPQADTIVELINFIEHNTKPSDKIIILPEGMMINFLTQRQSDDFYNSALPLYTETFSEEKFVENYKNTKTDYIIFNNQKMSDYGFDYICQDYGKKLCSYVMNEFFLINIIQNKTDKFLIYKKK